MRESGVDAEETSDVPQAPGGAGDAGRRDGCLRRLATRSDLIEVTGEQDAYARLDPPELLDRDTRWGEPRHTSDAPTATGRR